ESWYSPLVSIRAWRRTGPGGLARPAPGAPTGSGPASTLTAAQGGRRALCLRLRADRRGRRRPVFRRSGSPSRPGGRRTGRAARGPPAGARAIARVGLFSAADRGGPPGLAGRPAGVGGRPAGELRPHPLPPAAAGLGA